MDNMLVKPTKMDVLKYRLRHQHRTRSIAEAMDICDYLYKELRAGPRDGAKVTLIIVKEG